MMNGCVFLGDYPGLAEQMIDYVAATFVEAVRTV